MLAYRTYFNNRVHITLAMLFLDPTTVYEPAVIIAEKRGNFAKFPPTDVGVFQYFMKIYRGADNISV